MCGSVISSVTKGISSVVSGVGKAISSVAKSPIFRAIAPIALNFFLPGIGTAISGALNLSAAWAPVLSGAFTGGLMGAIGGGGVKGALKGAVLGGVTSGIADYAMTGNNPLSGMFSGQEGGMANNVLSAGGTGSTQLTGAGSELGLDRSTIGTQFGSVSANTVNPETLRPYGAGLGSPSGAPGLNPNVAGGTPGLSIAQRAPALNASAAQPGFFESLKGGNLLGAAKSLVPSTTMGKVGLGVTGLTVLNALNQKPQQMDQRALGQTDPTFNQRLEQLQLNYNPQRMTGSALNPNTYGMAAGAHDPTSFDPATGRFTRQRTDTAGEHQFFAPSYTPATPSAAAGGMIPSYNYGGYLNALAAGGNVDDGMASGLLRGPGDGISDSIPATIGGKQPARLAGGEFVVPARIVSELGNGSSEAGASRLDEFMKRVNERRLKTKDVASNSRAYELLPA